MTTELVLQGVERVDFQAPRRLISDIDSSAFWTQTIFMSGGDGDTRILMFIGPELSARLEAEYQRGIALQPVSTNQEGEA